MEESPLIHLDLRAPLSYTDAPGLTPFACLPPESEAAGELLFCFELDGEQAKRIDPDKDHFLGKLVFAGQSGPLANPAGSGDYGDRQLPAGLYLFAQQRRTFSSRTLGSRTKGSRALGREDCIAMAIEQQKDGLWERLRLGDRLYIRYLFEDGSPVTQLFRPYLPANR